VSREKKQGVARTLTSLSCFFRSLPQGLWAPSQSLLSTAPCLEQVSFQMRFPDTTINRNNILKLKGPGSGGQSFNPSPWESRGRGGGGVQGQPGTQSKFQNSQSYLEKPCLKGNKATQPKSGFPRCISKDIRNQNRKEQGSEFNSQQPHGSSQPSVMGSDALFWCVSES
jgi:hypothetical protein